jgi:hypothetical protein
MARYVTTRREEVVNYIINLLKAMPEFNLVERRLLEYEQLAQWAETSFPVVAVVAGLPVPQEKLTSRAKGGTIDKVISELGVDLYVYLHADENPDSRVSEILEALWIKLLEDESQGNLVLGTTLDPDPTVGYLHPYVAFRVTVAMRYVHDKGGI